MKQTREVAMLAVAAAGIFAVGQVQAAVVNFTAGEGYADGALNANADWSAKQWTVDSVAGTVTEDGYNNAVYTAESGAFVEGTAYRVSTTFTFNDPFDPSSQKWKPLFNAGFSSTNNANSLENQLVLAFDRANTAYGIDLQSDWGSTGGDNILGTGGSANASISASDAGITRGVDEGSSDLVSDRLQLTFELVAGATINDWTGKAVVTNVDTGVEIASFTATGLSFDAATLYGSFGVGQSDGNANVSNRTAHAFSFTTYTPPVPPATIVQWGEAGGDPDIVTNTISRAAPYNTTYEAGEDTSPTNASYYMDSTGRSPVFNVTMAAAWGTASVRNEDDYIQLGKNQDFFEGMIVWETFLTNNTHIKTLAAEVAGSGGGYVAISNSNFRFVIQKGTGEWYASDPTDLDVGFTSDADVDPTTLAWYDFTPLVGGAATVGATATGIDMTDVKAVGIYGWLDGRTNTAFQGFNMRYFKATAEPGPTTATILQWGDVSGDLDMVSATTNLLRKPNGAAWTAYEEGITNCPGGDAGYYTDATDRSPLFNYAAGVGYGTASVADNGDGDCINLGKNTADYQAMVTWYIPQDEPVVVKSLSAEARYQNSATNGVLRFIVKNATSGNWYASEGLALSGGYTTVLGTVADLAWFEFTPLSGGTGIVGVASTVDSSDLAAAGYYVTLEGNGGFQAVQVRRFSALGLMGAQPTPYELWVVDKGVTGGLDDDDDLDGVSNFMEYVFGGNPTDDTDQGSVPVLDVVTGDVNFGIRADATLSYTVETAPALANPTVWTTVSGPTSIVVDDGLIDSYSASVGTAADKLFIKVSVQ